MKKNLTLINYTKERAILSDVLPYETPLTFSNRHFYKFLMRNNINLLEEKLEWKSPNSNTNCISELIKLLFDFEKKTVTNESISFDKKWEEKSIPFIFKISHKENDFRDLTIIHPKNQVGLVSFYDRYKELILYYSDVSNFSIRKPFKVARYKVDKHKTTLDKKLQKNRDYENLKTFFSIKKYSNIHKFYESYYYHRCEKRYAKLFKFDISKCFDSIYTHSITWALLNKELVKDNISMSNETFGGHFDKFMQNTNYGETNGIVIGPEFSRIFAELILQQIDKKVYETLKEKKKYLKSDYEVFRYVDDFFVFYDDDSLKDEIVELYQVYLKEYKLGLNNSKSVLYEKPLITELSIAKIKISDLFNDHFKSKLTDEKSEKNDEESEKSEENTKEKYAIYVSSNRVISRFKAIVKETNVDYKDIMNYSMASIDRKVEKIIKDFNKLDDKKKHEDNFTKAILEILDVTFFFYSVSPKVNITIKLCQFMSKILDYLRYDDKFQYDNKHLIFKKIYDECTFVLNKNRTQQYKQVETLYLLITLRELGREYRLEPVLLKKYFDLENNDCLNYFCITVLLFYIKDISRYKDIQITLLEKVKTKIKDSNPDNLRKNTELILLLFDILACPFVTQNYKRELLSLYSVTDTTIQTKIIDYSVNTQKIGSQNGLILIIEKN
jgi:Reverse transcriptase (RNA-dependent DNA polymerase)